MSSPVAYSPATFLTDLGTGAATILPYVGAAVAGGLVLMFAFLGIKKGLAAYHWAAEGKAHNAQMSDWAPDNV